MSAPVYCLLAVGYIAFVLLGHVVGFNALSEDD